MVDPNDASCPDCGTPLAGVRTCPECGLRIRTDDDELTDDAVSAVVADALAEADGLQAPGEHVVPYSFRLAVALAIAVPFAPLSAFVLASVLDAHPIAIVIVGTVGWLAPAGVLARGEIPSLVVGRGLVALGIAVAASPPIAAAGRVLVGSAATTDPLVDGSRTLVGSFLVFGTIVLVLGMAVTRLGARKHDDWREADAVATRTGRR